MMNQDQYHASWPTKLPRAASKVGWNSVTKILPLGGKEQREVVDAGPYRVALEVFRKYCTCTVQPYSIKI